MKIFKPNNELVIIPENSKTATYGLVKSVEDNQTVIEIEEKEKFKGVKKLEILTPLENCMGKVTVDLLKLENEYIHISNPDEIDYLQQREWPRVDVSFPISFKMDEKEIGACAINISGGGMQIITLEKPDLNNIYNVCFNIQNFRRIRTSFKVLRIEDKKDYYILSGSFKWFSGMDKAAIIQMSFKRQLEALYKNKKSRDITNLTK